MRIRVFVELNEFVPPYLKVAEFASDAVPRAGESLKIIDGRNDGLEFVEFEVKKVIHRVEQLFHRDNGTPPPPDSTRINLIVKPFDDKTRAWLKEYFDNSTRSWSEALCPPSLFDEQP
jgi:hypothetical protein